MTFIISTTIYYHESYLRSIRYFVVLASVLWKHIFICLVLASKLSTRISFVVSINSCSTHIIKALIYCAQHLNDSSRNVKILLEFLIRHSQVPL